MISPLSPTPHGSIKSSNPSLVFPEFGLQICASPLRKWPVSSSCMRLMRRARTAARLGRKGRGSAVFAASDAASGDGRNGGLWASISSLRSSPSPPLSDVVWPAAGAFLAMGVMEIVDRLIAARGLRLTIAPFGAVCAVLFAAPATPAAQKYNIFVSHFGCSAIGVLALAIFGPGWVARSFALAASLAFMIYTGSLHPPAAGLPLLFIDGPPFHRLKWWYVIFPGTTGCILLCFMVQTQAFYWY
eukprot:TRINITY_DN564_c0_g1_i17.p1 TRINITY_DN564_c0_g1~~TRINITY_DN564_c0_g1_i17.p1  ORF type:complete len:244 (-),score=34.91 TRINITY_DN564_c0_g1_i17:158-889(-)